MEHISSPLSPQLWRAMFELLGIWLCRRRRQPTSNSFVGGQSARSGFTSFARSPILWVAINAALQIISAVLSFASTYATSEILGAVIAGDNRLALGALAASAACYAGLGICLALTARTGEELRVSMRYALTRYLHALYFQSKVPYWLSTGTGPGRPPADGSAADGAAGSQANGDGSGHTGPKVLPPAIPIDSADQRLTQDLDDLTRQLCAALFGSYSNPYAGITGSLASLVVTATAITAMSALPAGMGLAFALAISLALGYLARAVSLAYFRVDRAMGRLRAHHARLASDAEQILLLDGEPWEAATGHGFLAQYYWSSMVYYGLAGLQSAVSGFSSGYPYLLGIGICLVMAESLGPDSVNSFTGDIPGGTTDDPDSGSSTSVDPVALSTASAVIASYISALVALPSIWSAFASIGGAVGRVGLALRALRHVHGGRAAADKLACRLLGLKPGYTGRDDRSTDPWKWAGGQLSAWGRSVGLSNGLGPGGLLASQGGLLGSGGAPSSHGGHDDTTDSLLGGDTASAGALALASGGTEVTAPAPDVPLPSGTMQVAASILSWVNSPAYLAATSAASGPASSDNGAVVDSHGPAAPTLVLVGSSGLGKTSCMRVVSGLWPPSDDDPGWQGVVDKVCGPGGLSTGLEDIGDILAMDLPGGSGSNGAAGANGTSAGFGPAGGNKSGVGWPLFLPQSAYVKAGSLLDALGLGSGTGVSSSLVTTGAAKPPTQAAVPGSTGELCPPVERVDGLLCSLSTAAGVAPADHRRLLQCMQSYRSAAVERAVPLGAWSCSSPGADDGGAGGCCDSVTGMCGCLGSGTRASTSYTRVHQATDRGDTTTADRHDPAQLALALDVLRLVGLDRLALELADKAGGMGTGGGGGYHATVPTSTPGAVSGSDDLCGDWRARLSGGELQRLALARLLLQLGYRGGSHSNASGTAAEPTTNHSGTAPPDANSGPRLFLDESLCSVDPGTRARLLRLLRAQLGRVGGSLVLLSTNQQDAELASATATDGAATSAFAGGAVHGHSHGQASDATTTGVTVTLLGTVGQASAMQAWSALEDHSGGSKEGKTTGAHGHGGAVVPFPRDFLPPLAGQGTGAGPGHKLQGTAWQTGATGIVPTAQADKLTGPWDATFRRRLWRILALLWSKPASVLPASDGKSGRAGKGSTGNGNGHTDGGHGAVTMDTSALQDQGLLQTITAYWARVWAKTTSALTRYAVRTCEPSSQVYVATLVVLSIAACCGLAAITVAVASAPGNVVEAILAGDYAGAWLAFGTATGLYLLSPVLGALSRALGRALSLALYYRIVDHTAHRIMSDKRGMVRLYCPPPGQLTSAGQAKGMHEPASVTVTSTTAGAAATSGAIAIDRVDQRLVADSLGLTGSVGTLLFGGDGRLPLLQVLATIVATSIRVASRHGGLPLVCTAAYGVVGIGLSRLFLSRVPPAVALVACAESLLRSVHTRVRQAGESIGLLHGERAEGRDAEAALLAVVASSLAAIAAEFPSRLVNAVTANLSIVAAYGFGAVLAGSAAVSATRATAAFASATGAADEGIWRFGHAPGLSAPGLSAPDAATVYSITFLLSSLLMYVAALPDYLTAAAEVSGYTARVGTLLEALDGDPHHGTGADGAGGGAAAGPGPSEAQTQAPPVEVYEIAAGPGAGSSLQIGPVSMRGAKDGSGHAHGPAGAPRPAGDQGRAESSLVLTVPAPVAHGTGQDHHASTWLTITGPSGCGKSSALRLIGGLWPSQSHSSAVHASGAGAVTATGAQRLPRHAVMFLPQQPYVPPAPASLLECVTYGSNYGHGHGAGDGAGAGAGGRAVSITIGSGSALGFLQDLQRVIQALERVGLLGPASAALERCLKGLEQQAVASGVADGGGGPELQQHGQGYRGPGGQALGHYVHTTASSTAVLTSRLVDWRATLSRGEKARLAIARVLYRYGHPDPAARPRLVIADEPLVGLDEASVEALRQALDEVGAAVVAFECR